MHAVRPNVKLWEKVWRYQSIALLCHLTTNRIVSVPIRAMRSDMAPSMCMDRALTSSRVKPTCGPVMATAVWRDLVMSVIRTDIHLLLRNTLAKGVWMVAQWQQRYSTRQLMAATLYALGCPVVPWTIYLPLNPFFCLVKRKLRKVAEVNSCGVAVVSGVG